MSEQKKVKNPLLESEEPNKEGTAQSPAKVESPEKPAVSTPPVKPAENPATIEAQLQDEISKTKAALEASPHVDFIIPVMPGENPNVPESVQINGYRVEIKKGIMVNIPYAVAKLLADKYRIQMEAGKEKRIDRASDVEDALG